MSTHHGRNDASSIASLLLNDGQAAPLAVLSRRLRARDRLVLGLRSHSLDAQLAAGRSPDDEQLRAIRADVLVSPRTRRALARHWEQLVRGARTSRRGWDPRFPLSSPRILSAEGDIRRLVHALQDSSPVPARGVAMASQLLADGTGPLYHGRTARSLEDAVREAIRHLDPTTALQSS